MSRRFTKNKKGKPKVNPSKSKKLDKQLASRFVDAKVLYDKTPGSILAIGTLDPNLLTAADHKKHGALYVSINDMPEVH